MAKIYDNNRTYNKINKENKTGRVWRNPLTGFLMVSLLSRSTPSTFFPRGGNAQLWAMFLPNEGHLVPESFLFYWGMITKNPQLGTYQNSRLSEGKQVFSINDIVQTG